MTRPVITAAIASAVALVVCWPRPGLSHETVTTTVLFDREIVRVLDSHCVMCHVEGGPSFPLATYEQAWLQKRRISAAVLARHMPPWAALPGYGRFANENVVTLRESQFIVSWMEGLGPRNAGRVFTNTAASGAAKPSEVRAHVDFGGWRVGQPDLTRALAPTVVEPRLPDDVVRTVVDLGLTGERRVRAVEYIPGDRRVVRAAFFTVQETGQWIGSWTPWFGFMQLPDGAAYRLPVGAHVVAEVHYRHSGDRVVDRGTLGFFFETRASTQPVSELTLDARNGALAAADGVRLQAEQVLADDTVALALLLERIAGLKSVEVRARRPDGGTEVLLFAKDIPPDWPTPYIFKDPVPLRRGTTLSMTAYADPAISPAPDGVRLTVSAYRRGDNRSSQSGGAR